MGKIGVKRPRKKKNSRKNVLPPSIFEVRTTMQDMEEDLKDTFP